LVKIGGETAMSDSDDESGWVKLNMHVFDLKNGSPPCVLCAALTKPPTTVMHLKIDKGRHSWGGSKVMVASYPLCDACAGMGETNLIDEVNKRAGREAVRDLHLER
jgi:hypothetical protein